ncbi:SH3 domain-containing protein [Streptomyces sp. NPDC057623]|uniref:SH3 domain-containing protein n=1 Tax=Streptomyces sp. NPDC057623 TaxID=3346187 RepID=UPI0036C877F0
MKLRQNLTRSLAASSLGLSVIGAGIATAPAASAASLPKACDWEWAWPQPNKATAAVNLRKGAGIKYTSLGILRKGTRFTEYCNKEFKWDYGKVASGPNKGKWGWVKSEYLDPQ